MNTSKKLNVRFLCLAGGIALACSSPFTAHAQITAGGTTATRPVVDNTANGRPLVQIMAPNAAGVSHNQYQQFNVDRNGALLNNATGNALTKQGGWVGANPNLGGNAARLIVNEVTSANPSQLRGYLEVAGQRADVVVANPNGIMVDGFGFINASRGVLTTGTPVFGGAGSLEALRVTQGNITLAGGGLNDQGTAQLDLIARSVQVNAALWADRLNVVTGANRVNYGDLGVQLIQGAGDAPTVALDVAAIGGMYANRIRLVGTEHGVGVMSYGKMASAGDFQIDSTGKITLNADASAGGALRIGAGEAIVNQARISSGGAMALRAASIANQGKEILAGGDLSIAAGTLDNTAGSIRSNRNAQLGVQGGFAHARGNTVAAAGDLAIVTAGDFANQTELSAGGNLSVQAANVSNGKDGLLSAGQTMLVQAGQTVSNTGRIYGQDVAISAQTVTNDHEGVYGDNVPAGVIAARNTLNIGAATVVNREHALLKSDGDLAIGGALDAGNKASGQATSVTNSSATIDAGGKMGVDSAALLNTNAHFATEIHVHPEKTRSVVEYERNGIVYTPEQANVYTDDGLQKMHVAGQAPQNDWTRRNYTETTRTTVVTQTDPGKIQARGDIVLSGQVTNDKSAIVAGGTLSGQTGDIRNIDVKGESIVRRQGTSTWHSTSRSGIGSRRDTWADTPLDYDLPATHFDLALWKVQANTMPAGAANPASGNRPHVALLPANQLYRPASAPGMGYFIETDQAFVNLRSFLSSDYLLGRLAMNPATAQKRLGDGYYEQQLVNDQILRLTGRKNLGVYASNEDQYRALMDAGVSYAQSFGIVPGVSLSAAQMAQLTSDIVWLVEQAVTLPDGSTQTALVPRVYLSRLRAQDLKPTGALIAADNINLQINGSLANAGTLQADTGLVVNATQDIANTFGTLSSNAATGATTLTAGRDLINQSGTISGNRVAILAGRDVNIGTATGTAVSAHGTQVSLDRSGGISAGALSLQAQRDVNLNAATIGTTGDAVLQAGNNLNLNAVKTQEELNVTYDDRNHLYKRQEQANGTNIQAGGNATLTAGRDVNAQAAYINSGQALKVTAVNDINVSVAMQGSSYDQEVYTASSGLLSSHSIHTKDKQAGSQSVGSTFSGNTVAAQAGRDLNLSGSNIVSTADTRLSAQGNVNIVTSQDTTRQTYSRVEKRSGVFSGGGLGVTIGNRTLENEQASTQVTNNASTVGSTGGNVTITAGQSYVQTGSQVLAPKGDIAIAARQVDINAATNSFDATQDTRFRQTGITLQVVSPVLSAIQAVQQLKQAAGKVKDARMKGLAAGVAALTVANAATQINESAAPAGGIDLAISLGTSQSKSHSEQHAATAIGSTAAAGGNLSVIASGAGAASNLNIVGSEINAGRNLLLAADNQLNLTAARNTSEQHSTNSNSSASVGMSVGTSGLMFSAAASGGRGKGDGNDVHHANSHATASQQLAMRSGADMSLNGGVAKGQQVVADVGGNLNIASLQDSSQYKSRQQSMGGSLSGGPGRGISGSINASRSKVDGNFVSVTEQSAINAGDGGFQVKVAGNTDLKGAKIASTDKAVQEGRNQLQTAGLSTGDIHNKSEYKAESQSASAGAGYDGTRTSMNGSGVGMGSASGSDASVTRSGVSGIAGDATVRSDKDSSPALAKKWDGQQLQQDVEAQARITEAFGKQAAKAIGDYAGAQLKKATDAGDAEGIAKWKEGGAYRTALHAAAGALGGGLAGAAGATASSLSMPLIAEQIDKMEAPNALKQALAQAAAGALGITVGGAQGLASAVNVEANNRQLHPREITWLEMNKERASKALSDKLERPVSEQEALRYLTMAGEGNTDQVYQRQYANDLGLQTSEERQLYNAAKQYIAQYARESFVDDRGQKQSLFVARGNDFKDGSVYGQYRNDQAYRDFYWNTMGDNLKPDNPSAQELAIYQQREKIRLENSARQLATGAIPAVMGWTAGAIVKNGVKSGSKPEEQKVEQQAAEVPGKVQEEVAALERMKNNPAGPDLTGKASGTVLDQQLVKNRNQQAVSDLKDGKLPGTPIDGPGSPREMASSYKPSETAEDFAIKALGRAPTAEDFARGRSIIGGCPNCWIGKTSDGMWVTYRPAGKAGDGTVPTTATVDLNGAKVNNLNLDKWGRPDNVKLKFPEGGSGANSAGRTGTVFDSIAATQPVYPGSAIPRSFEMALPNGQRVWVAGNATEHMAEFAQMKAVNYTPEAVRLASQQQLSSLQGAVNTATKNGITYNQVMTVGGWELKFAPPRQPGQLPSIIHALPTGK